MIGALRDYRRADPAADRDVVPAPHSAPGDGGASASDDAYASAGELIGAAATPAGHATPVPPSPQ
jgi:hypothetical protein